MCFPHYACARGPYPTPPPGRPPVRPADPSGIGQGRPKSKHKAAVATIVTGQVLRIDVGGVNGCIFLNNSSIGVYPWIVRERQKDEGKGYGKRGARHRGEPILPLKSDSNDSSFRLGPGGPFAPEYRLILARDLA
jgi:hypothetical protein